MRRLSIVPGMLTRSSAPGNAEPPSGAAGEAAPEGEEAAKQWADEEAIKIGHIWLKRYPEGKDW